MEKTSNNPPKNEEGGKTIHLDPLREEDLEDKRNLIAENCFIEIDIALKSYSQCFGEDFSYDELSLLHSTIAYILSSHEIKHKLSNVDMEQFSIPKSPFKTKEGTPTDKLFNLTESDKIHYITNLIMNSKLGFHELNKSEYFEKMNKDLMVEKNGLLFQTNIMYDRSILLLNNKYSKLILNIK